MHKCINLVCNVIFIPEFQRRHKHDDIVSEVKKDTEEEDEGGE
jgi:hypothetical protein